LAGRNSTSRSPTSTLSPGLTRTISTLLSFSSSTRRLTSSRVKGVP